MLIMGAWTLPSLILFCFVTSQSIVEGIFTVTNRSEQIDQRNKWQDGLLAYITHGKFLFYRLQAGKCNVKMNKLETL